MQCDHKICCSICFLLFCSFHCLFGPLDGIFFHAGGALCLTEFLSMCLLHYARGPCLTCRLSRRAACTELTRFCLSFLIKCVQPYYTAFWCFLFFFLRLLKQILLCCGAYVGKGTGTEKVFKQIQKGLLPAFPDRFVRNHKIRAMFGRHDKSLE